MIIYDKSNYFLMKIKLSFLTIIFSKIFLYSATQLNSLPKFGYLEKKNWMPSSYLEGVRWILEGWEGWQYR